MGVEVQFLGTPDSWSWAETCLSVVGTLWYVVTSPFRLVFWTIAWVGRLAAILLGFSLMVVGIAPLGRASVLPGNSLVLGRAGADAQKPRLTAFTGPVESNLISMGRDWAPDPILLDHNATAPLDLEVLEAMRPHFLGRWQHREPAHVWTCSAATWESARGTVPEFWMRTQRR